MSPKNVVETLNEILVCEGRTVAPPDLVSKKSVDPFDVQVQSEVEPSDVAVTEQGELTVKVPSKTVNKIMELLGFTVVPEKVKTPAYGVAPPPPDGVPNALAEKFMNGAETSQVGLSG